MFFEMFSKFGQMFSHKHLYDVSMFVKTGEAYLVDVSKFTLFDEFDKKPEG
jgi:hypothetical protein